MPLLRKAGVLQVATQAGPNLTPMCRGTKGGVVARTRRQQPSPVITQRHEVLAHHGDDWYPCLAGHRVLVSLYVQTDSLDARVTVWGADDTGVETGALTLAHGLDLYTRITANTCPPRRSLIARWGFRPA